MEKDKKNWRLLHMNFALDAYIPIMHQLNQHQHPTQVKLKLLEFHKIGKLRMSKRLANFIKAIHPGYQKKARVTSLLHT